MHLSEAERLISNVPAAQNTYKPTGEPNRVVWGDPDWVVYAQCASFLTSVLSHSYPSWATDSYFLRFFGSVRPLSRDFYRVFAAGAAPHFTAVRRVADLLPGDYIAIDYRGTASNGTGHLMMVRRVLGATASEYLVEIIDCTADPHGPLDSRTSGGAGYGHMLFYASSDAFSGYRWSVDSRMAYSVSDRPIAAARIT